MGCRWISAPPWTSMGCRGTSLPHHGLHHRLHGNLCSGAWSTVSCSFFTDLGVCRVVSLTYSHSPLSAAVPQRFLPLLKFVVTEALPPLLIGSALASGRSLEPSGTSSIQHRASTWCLPTEAPPLPKPCHVNPMQGCSNLSGNHLQISKI